MESKEKSFKIAAGVAIVLMIGAVTWGAWNARINHNLQAERDQEKLRTEALLSEKLLVEKTLASTETQMEGLLRKNESLTQQLEEAGNLNELKEGSIKQLQRQLASNKKTYADLAAANQEMQNKLSLLNQQIALMQSEQLAANQEADALRGQIDNLKKELALAHNAYYDKVLVEASRGKKDKLVVKATRAKKLKATVMIPAELKDVQFQVFDPSGKLISSSPENGMLAVKISDNTNTVASSSGNSSGQTYKQAEMTFLPKKKLVSGTYRIEVLSENLSVGTLQLKLR